MANIFQKILGRQPHNLLFTQAFRSFHCRPFSLQCYNQSLLLNRSFINTPVRMLFTQQKQNQLLLSNRILMNEKSNQYNLTSIPTMNFSLKIRRRKARRIEAQPGKFKLKTKKAFQKRFKITGSLRDRKFKYHAVGYHHLNRNKSRRNLATKRKGYFLTCQGNIRCAKKLFPYFRRRKYLKS